MFSMNVDYTLETKANLYPETIRVVPQPEASCHTQIYIFNNIPIDFHNVQSLCFFWTFEYSQNTKKYIIRAIPGTTRIKTELSPCLVVG